MTQENIFKTFLEDPLLVEKKYISKEKAEKLKYHEPSGVKLLDVIKMAIDSNIKEESDQLIARKINQFLNK